MSNRKQIKARIVKLIEQCERSAGEIQTDFLRVGRLNGDAFHAGPSKTTGILEARLHLLADDLSSLHREFCTQANELAIYLRCQDVPF